MKFKPKTVSEALVGLLLVCVLVAATSVWRAYVACLLWAWFVVPMFALPALRIPVAIGLSAMLMLFQQRGFEEDDEELSAVVLRLLLTPAVCLLFGWVALKFV